MSDRSKNPSRYWLTWEKRPVQIHCSTFPLSTSYPLTTYLIGEEKNSHSIKTGMSFCLLKTLSDPITQKHISLLIWSKGRQNWTEQNFVQVRWAWEDFKYTLSFNKTRLTCVYCRHGWVYYLLTERCFSTSCYSDTTCFAFSPSSIMRVFSSFHM